MTHIPFHLSLTGQALMITPSVLPDLSKRLEAHQFTARETGILNRLKRRQAKAPAIPSSLASSMVAKISLPENGSVSAQTVAVMSIEGPLLHKACYWGDALHIDGYNRIEATLNELMADQTVKAILIKGDTPGGMVTGCFELSRKIKKMTAVKPIIWFNEGLTASAGYSLASACTEIHSLGTAVIGSIGVIRCRSDVTAAMDKAGFKLTVFKSDEKKDFGNPETQMTDAEAVESQEEIDYLANHLRNLVAANRPDLTTQIIKDLAAGTKLGAQAPDFKLVDAISDLQGALARAQELAADKTNPKSSNPKETANMSKTNLARARAVASLSAIASAMTVNMMTEEEQEAMDEEAIHEVVDDETDTAMDDMDDEDAAAIDEDTQSMDDEEDFEATEEDDLDAMDDEEEPTAQAVASRIAHASLARLRASNAAAKKVTGQKSRKSSAAPKGSGDRLAVASAIMALPEAANNPAHARTLAFHTDMSVDDAREALKADNTASAAALAGIPDPAIGAGGKSASSGHSIDHYLAKDAEKRRKA